MFIHQTDLFRGMNKDFVKQVFDLAVKESIADKDVLFSEGDQAKHFYILLKGRVKLSTGETGQVVHTVSRPGEAFGWSSLVGRDVYSASAKCLAPTTLVIVNRNKFQEILDKEPIARLFV